jgi:hypothetical protein
VDLPPDLESRKSDDELNSLSLSTSDTSVASWDVDYTSDSKDDGINGLLQDYHTKGVSSSRNNTFKQSYNDDDAANDLRDLQDLHFLQDTRSTWRGDRWDHKRLDWDSHVEQLQHEGSFANEYCMTLPTHGKLIRILDPLL